VYGPGGGIETTDIGLMSGSIAAADILQDFDGGIRDRCAGPEDGGNALIQEFFPVLFRNNPAADNQNIVGLFSP
jgi:hypothetical protein